jgi:hypothetical protein
MLRFSPPLSALHEGKHGPLLPLLMWAVALATLFALLQRGWP